MFGLGVKSLRYYKPLFIGAFLAMMLGVALIGLASIILTSTWSIPPSHTGPSVTLTGPSGGTHTFYSNAPDMQGVTTILALGAVVAGFMTIMVVTGTFSFSIALRRRVLGQLRLLGADGGQIRRMILGESLTVAVPAGAIGCLLAALLAPPAVHALNRTGLSPVPLPDSVGTGPLLFAFGMGLLLALGAAFLASSRAARVRPIEALQDAALDTNVMTRGRWLAGLVTLAAGTLMMASTPSVSALNSTPLAIFGTFALTIAAVTLGPVYLPWSARLFGLPTRWTNGLAGHLALAGITASRRRTSSLVAPVLSITAVVGIMLGVMESSDATDSADQLARIRGQLIARSTSGAGLDAATLQRLAGAPHVRAVSAPAPTKVAFTTENNNGSFVQRNGSGVVIGAAVNLPALAAAERVDAVEGRVAPLGAGQIAVRQEYVDWYGVHAGSRVRLSFFDGRTAEVTVVAVLHGEAHLPEIMMSPELAGGQAAPPPTAIITLDASPADPATAAARLSASTGAQVVPTAAWHQNDTSAQTRLQRVVVTILAGPASVFALVAIANILVMSFSRRGREVAGLTLLGAPAGLVRRMVATEALLMTTIGIGMAAIFVTAGLTGFHHAQEHDYLAAAVQVPWLELIILAVGCTVISVVTSLIVVGRMLRRPAMAELTIRE
jgi:putative ABC transport system permease protein